jgi:glycosyltransferase involved in cell wall biosynthesis
MADSIPSIHILGSREFGGADQFYVRLIRALHDAGHPTTAINRTGSPVARALNENSVEQIHVPLANQWDLWSRWKISREIAKRQPCVVQSYMGRATRHTRVPEKSSAVHIARLGGFYKIDGYYRHANAWVGNTRAICDFLVKAGLPSTRVYHIGNFVPDVSVVNEAEKAQSRIEHEIDADAWILFSLGRLRPKKGFHDLLHALAKLPKEIGGRPVVLMIAGDGPEFPGLQTLAKELQIDHQIRWLGWQNAPARFYALADAFICPSRHEPLGNVILEAWSHEKPVISTRSDGALELIEDGQTGLLCDCNDSQGMAMQIQKMLEASPSQRTALATAGRIYLEKHFSRDAIVSAYLSLYREMLASKA